MLKNSNTNVAYKTKKFFKYLNSLDDFSYLENLLMYNTTLIKAWLKPSVTFTILKGQRDLYTLWQKFGKSLIHKLDLDFIILRDNKNSLILFIYDEKILGSHLKISHNQEFLLNMGYDITNSTSNIVSYLKMRYNLFHCPHELGIFLGYPIEDVREFMSCTPKECLLCGYWKVYNNYQDAVKTFISYDKARENFIDEFLLEKEKLTS